MVQFFGGIVLVIVVLIIIGCATNYAEQKQHEKDTRLRFEDKMNWRKCGVVESYKRRGLNVVPGNSKCPICGTTNTARAYDGNGGRAEECKTCGKRYAKDKQDGVIPDGIVCSQAYNFSGYWALRLIEWEYRNGKIDESEMNAKRQALIAELNARYEQRCQPKPKPAEKPFDTSYRDNYLS